MGDLAKHIAEAARRIYPEPALPAEATELFTEMQQFLSMTADRIVVMLQDRDAKTAEEIILDDDKLDALHHKTFDLALSDKWTGSRQQLIDVVLLGRFMERLVRLRSEQGAVARRGRRRRVTTTAAMPSPAFRHN